MYASLALEEFICEFINDMDYDTQCTGMYY